MKNKIILLSIIFLGIVFLRDTYGQNIKNIQYYNRLSKERQLKEKRAAYEQKQKEQREIIRRSKSHAHTTSPYKSKTSNYCYGLVYDSQTSKLLENVSISMSYQCRVHGIYGGSEEANVDETGETDKRGMFYFEIRLEAKSIEFVFNCIGYKTKKIITEKSFPLFVEMIPNNSKSKGYTDFLDDSVSFLLPDKTISLALVLGKNNTIDKKEKEWFNKYNKELKEWKMCVNPFRYSKNNHYIICRQNFVTKYPNYDIKDNSYYDYNNILSSILPEYERILDFYYRMYYSGYNSYNTQKGMYKNMLKLYTYKLPETLYLSNTNDSDDIINENTYLNRLNNELLNVELQRDSLIKNLDLIASGYLKNQLYNKQFVLSANILSVSKQKRARKEGHIFKKGNINPQLQNGDFEIKLRLNNEKSYSDSKEQYVSFNFSGKCNNDLKRQKDIKCLFQKKQLKDGSIILIKKIDDLVSIYLNSTKIKESSLNSDGSILSYIDKIIITGNKIAINYISNTTLNTNKNRNIIINTFLTQKRKKLEAQMIYIKSIFDEVLKIMDIAEIFQQFEATAEKSLEVKIEFINNYPFFERTPRYNDVLAYNIINSNFYSRTYKCELINKMNGVKRYDFVKKFLNESENESIRETINEINEIQYAEDSFEKKISKLSELEEYQRKVFYNYDIEGDIYDIYINIVDEEVKQIKKNSNSKNKIRVIQELRNIDFVKKNNDRNMYLRDIIQQMIKANISTKSHIEYITTTKTIPAYKTEEVVDKTSFMESLEGKKTYAIETTYYPSYENTKVSNYRVKGSVQNNNDVSIRVKATTCYSYLGFLLATMRSCESTYIDVKSGERVNYEIGNTYNGNSKISVYYEVIKYNGLNVY